MLDKGYGILPNRILFDSELSSTAKLVYVYISSLCAERGYCWASNEKLAERFETSSSTISRAISQLERYLIIENPTSARRRIYLCKNEEQHTQKCSGNIRKNAQHNNISNITKENYKQNTPAKAVEKEPDVQAMRLTALFLEDIFSRYQWLDRKSPQEKYKKQSEMYENIEKIHRIDGFDYTVIEAVIKWVCNDSFWRSNILSGSKLRKQLPNLLVKIKETHRETVVL